MEKPAVPVAKDQASTRGSFGAPFREETGPSGRGVHPVRRNALAGRSLSARRLLPSRVASMFLVLIAAGIHASVIREHFDESWILGTGFVVMATVQAVWVVAARRHWSPWVVIVGVLGNAIIIGVWVASRTVGLPVGPDPWTPEPVGVLDGVATLCEALVVLLGVTAWGLRRRPAYLSSGP